MKHLFIHVEYFSNTFEFQRFNRFISLQLFQSVEILISFISKNILNNFKQSFQIKNSHIISLGSRIRFHFFLTTISIISDLLHFFKILFQLLRISLHYFKKNELIYFNNFITYFTFPNLKKITLLKHINLTKTFTPSRIHSLVLF